MSSGGGSRRPVVAVPASDNLVCQPQVEDFQGHSEPLTPVTRHDLVLGKLALDDILSEHLLQVPGDQVISLLLCFVERDSRGGGCGCSRSRHLEKIPLKVSVWGILRVMAGPEN